MYFEAKIFFGNFQETAVSSCSCLAPGKSGQVFSSELSTAHLLFGKFSPNHFSRRTDNDCSRQPASTQRKPGYFNNKSFFVSLKLPA